MFVCVAYLAFCVLSSLISVEMSGGWGGHFVYVIPYIQKKGVWGGAYLKGALIGAFTVFFPLVTGPLHSEERKPRSLKLREDQTVKSPFISDIYGCFTLRLRSNYGWLYVFLQFMNEEEELVYIMYVEQGQKYDVYIRLKSFVRGSYRVIITHCSSFDSSLNGIQNVTEI